MKSGLPSTSAARSAGADSSTAARVLAEIDANNATAPADEEG